MYIDIPWYLWFYKINYKNNSVVRVLDKWWYMYLKTYLSATWHLQIWLTINKSRKTWWLHQLVMLIKEWPCPVWMEVCHNDWNPQNNHPDNLRYDTRSSNMKDRYKHWYVSFFTLDHPMKWKKWWLSIHSRSVIQYSTEWIKIKEWSWIREAWRSLWIKHINICKNCKWERKTAWWFIWKYK